MNRTNYEQLQAAVEKTLDRRSRHWKDEYDTFSAADICRLRRQAAIEDVTYDLSDDFDHLDDATFHAVVSLIVDNSYMAWMGFDALNTTPSGPWWRRLTRQITNTVVSSARV